MLDFIVDPKFLNMNMLIFENRS